MEKEKKKHLSKPKLIAAVLIAALLFGAGIAGGLKLCKTFNHDTKISQTIIEAQLKECSELSTCKLDYRGIVPYEDGSIPFLTKKGFAMSYKAYIKAGVDLDKADVAVRANEISITLPKARLMDIVVDENSLEFYDEKFALFNWGKKEDLQKALSYAKKDAEKKAVEDETGLLAAAEEHAEEVIQTMLAPLIDKSDDCELKIRIAE